MEPSEIDGILEEGGRIPHVSIGYDKTLYISLQDGWAGKPKNILYSINPEERIVNWGFAINDLKPTQNRILATSVYNTKTVYLRSIDPSNTTKSIYAIDAKNGKLLWDFNANEKFRGDKLRGDENQFSIYPPAIGYDGTVYFTEGHGNNLYALDSKTGKEKWVFKMNPVSEEFEERMEDYFINTSPVIDKNGILYFASANQYFYAIDSTSGKKKWQYEFQITPQGTNIGHYGGRPHTPAIGKNNMVYLSANRTGIFAFNGKTGEKIWEMRSEDYMGGPVITPKGNVIVPGATSFDGLTGAVLWHSDAHHAITPVIGNSDLIYTFKGNMVTNPGIIVLKSETGKKIKEFENNEYRGKGLLMSNNGNLLFNNHERIFSVKSLDDMPAKYFWPMASNNSQQTGRNLPIKISIAPAKSGDVSILPELADYPLGSKVTLKAVPEDGYIFNSWSGDASGSANPLVITMNGNKTIMATFEHVPTIFIQQPIGKTVIADNTTSFNANVSGIEPLTYQWKFEGEPISGATDSSLTLRKINVSQAGNYSLMVTNGVGSTIESDTAKLTVHFALDTSTIGSGTVAISPNLDGYTPGTEVTLNAEPSGDYIFESWSEDATDKSNLLTITMDMNKVIKANFKHVPTVITKHPIGKISIAGNTVTFNASATGIEPLTYQWKHNDSTIAGATASTLILSNVKKADDGNYSVLVTNGVGSSVESNEAKLTVQFALVTSVKGLGNVLITPKLESYPAAAKVTLNAVPSDEYIFESWSGDSSGKANPLTITMDGNKAIVANFLEFVTIAITKQPESQEILAGRTVQFKVETTGNPPLKYQWKFNGLPLDGSDGPALELNNVKESFSGEFTVTITNEHGEVTSEPAVLTVIKDSDLDGLSDVEEQALNSDPNNADTDSDGLNDGEEVSVHKTDPTIEDTDQDGLLDGLEIRGGFDPTVATEREPGSLKIRTAVELEFFTLEWEQYQLQSSLELTNWTNEGEPFKGVGGYSSIYQSARDSKVFWRLKVVD
ncbi:MAG: PQQ-binding-like beta-propeller repeat protein [Opitutae bacterium]|nr:PQQ-binding-like beta-propeller repeat protein [Opitutae bacterium]